jgi:integrase
VFVQFLNDPASHLVLSQCRIRGHDRVDVRHGIVGQVLIADKETDGSLDPARLTMSKQPPYLGPPKTAESERVVPLAQVTLDVLAAHLAVYPARTVMITDRTDPRNPVEREARMVFTLDDGTAVARHSWSEIWVPAAKAAGLPSRTGCMHCVTSTPRY